MTALELLAPVLVAIIVMYEVFIVSRMPGHKWENASLLLPVSVPVMLLIVSVIVRRGLPLQDETVAIMVLFMFGLARSRMVRKPDVIHYLSYFTLALELTYLVVFILDWMGHLDMETALVPMVAFVMAAAYLDLIRPEGKGWIPSCFVDDPSARAAGYASSMKQEHVRTASATSDEERMDVLYERIIAYMESGQPYLDPDLQMSDVAAAVFTNKAYLSKTVNTMSGKNFCQFINSYRIDYAVGVMKSDSRIKMGELALMSGFHSAVSFNMAFKLNMNSTPSEYMRTIQAGKL